jgi:hypothetical protein
MPHPVPDWHRLLDEIRAVRPAGQDLFLIIAARRGYAGWQPQMDRLPSQLASAFPDVDFVILHPPLPDTGDERETMEPEPDPAVGELITADRIIAEVPDGDLAVPLTRLLTPILGRDPARAAAAATHLAGREPVELAPGILLLHGHEAGIPTSIAFLITRRAGVRVPGLDRPAHALFILLGPTDQPPVLHLKALVRIARAVRSPEFRRRLESGAAPEHLADALRTNAAPTAGG